MKGAGGRGKAAAGESALAASLWGIHFVDFTGVVSQSTELPKKMMGVIVVVRAAFGVTVLEAKAKIMCLRTKGMPEANTIFSVEAVGQIYHQMNEFVYPRGNFNHNADLSIEIDWRIRNARRSLRKYTLELCNRPTAPLKLEIRMLRAEILGAMLYCSAMWSRRASHYDTLRQAHHNFLPPFSGWRRNNHTDHPISYLRTFMKTGRESIEAMMRRR